MGRPRKSATVLKLAGAFERNPQRERQDVPGTGEFNREPPQRLHKNYHAAWRHIVERLPGFAFSASDEPLVEHAARLLGKMWEYEQHLETVLRLHAPLMGALQALGMSPTARAKLGTSTPSGKQNRFQSLSEDEQ